MRTPARRLARRAYAAGARAYLAPLLRHEWRAQRLRAPNERSVEYLFALEEVVAAAPTTILDVGTGLSAWPHLLSTCGFHVTAIDAGRGYWRDDVFNRHFHVRRDDVRRPAVAGPFDLVTCISVLEHIPEHEAAVAAMLSLLRPGGRLVLTFPYNERRYVEDVYALPEAGYGAEAAYVAQVFSRAQLDGWLAASGAALARERLYEACTGELWTFGERLAPPRPTTADRPHHLAAVSLVKPR